VHEVAFHRRRGERSLEGIGPDRVIGCSHSRAAGKAHDPRRDIFLAVKNDLVAARSLRNRRFLQPTGGSDHASAAQTGHASDKLADTAAFGLHKYGHARADWLNLVDKGLCRQPLEEPCCSHSVVDARGHWNGERSTDHSDASIGAIVSRNVSEPVARHEVREAFAHRLDRSDGLKARDTGQVERAIGTRVDVDIVEIDRCCLLADEQFALARIPAHRPVRSAWPPGRHKRG